MLSCAEALARVQLTKEEERAITKLEAVIDGVIRDKFNGVPLQLPFSEQIAPKLAYELQRKYERGGWKATITAGAKLTVQLTPTVAAPVVVDAPTTAAPPQPAMLPPMAQLSSQATAAAGRRLLVRMPTRGRPIQALKVLELYRNMAGCPIQIEVVIDEDDETMLAIEVQQRLIALGCVITVGKHKSKVEAVNGGRLTEWDVLLLASDDMWPVVDGFGIKVLVAMEQHWPHLDGALLFDDGVHGPSICTLPIMGRRWWEQQGRKIYADEYESLFCDNEQTELWRAQGRLTFVDQKIIEHRHPAWGKADIDALYERNNALTKRDQAVYEKRTETSRPHAQWAFDSPPLWLSILICTIPSREAKLEHLLDQLWAQIYRLPVDVEGADPRMVEILIDGESGIKIGTKRQRLLTRARGHYVVSIDDDDSVSYKYMATIIDTLHKNIAVDCLAIRGVMTTAGVVPETFEHSIKHGWETKDGMYFRPINHINPVRREIALQVGFDPEKHYNEDQDFGERLRSVLKTEASTGNDLLYYYLFTPKAQ